MQSQNIQLEETEDEYYDRLANQFPEQEEDEELISTED